MSMKLKLVILAVLVQIMTPTTSFYFKFSNFTENNAGKLIYGDTTTSKIRGPAIQIVVPRENLAGRVLYRKPFMPWKRRGDNASFNTSLTFNVTPQTSPGGEGFAFILTGDTKVPPDTHGQWLGIISPQLNGSVKAKTVAIEFDTRKNFLEDKNGTHIGLNINSVYSRNQVLFQDLNFQYYQGTVWMNIVYDGVYLSVRANLNNSMRGLVFSDMIDLSEYLPKHVYVGFPCSTSNFTGKHLMKNRKFYGTEKKSIRWVLIGVPLEVALLLSGLIICFFWKKVIKPEHDFYPNIEEEISCSYSTPIRFKLKDLKKATRQFNMENRLGWGGFGMVYTGILRNKEVAVKKISKKAAEGKQEFLAEITTIGNLNHRNLVKLMGWCHEKKEFLIVYDYTPNGSVDRFIFNPEAQVTLGWEQRRDIISGVAQAVDYLHHGCDKRVIHRDLKSSNVMLDSNFKAKLGDFGLARVIKQGQTHHTTECLAGTMGYMAPEFIMTRRATVQTDIYAFGVLILEIACGRRPGNKEEDETENNYIVKWVWDLYGRNEIIKAADARLNGQFEKEEMESLLVLGLACCHLNPNKRPSLNVVVQIKGEAPVPEVQPERPRFVWPALPPSDNSSIFNGQLLSFSFEGR